MTRKRPFLFPVRFLPVFLAVVAAWAAASCAAAPSETGQRAWTEPRTGIEFVWIPGGCFQFACEADASSAREVCTGGFWLGRFEVTVAQFDSFARSSGYRTESEKEGFSWAYTGEWSKKAGIAWRNAGFEQVEKSPVVHVSWNDAQAMAKWLSDGDKGAFRLPSEAEWEYACRLGMRSAGGDKDGESAPQDICRSANVADKTAALKFPAWKTADCEDGHVYTAPVGSFAPNGLGIYDLLGNVWEWCADVCGQGGGSGTGDAAPRAVSGHSRAIRGGSWYTPGASCSTREVLQSESRRSSDIGFRLLRTE